MLAYLSFFMGLAIVQDLTPIHIVELRPLSEVWIVVGSIAMMLAGAYPLVKILTKVLGTPLGKLGALIGINEVSAAGLIACCANSIPAYNMIKNMDNRGKIVNISFACCAAFALGRLPLSIPGNFTSHPADQAENMVYGLYYRPSSENILERDAWHFTAAAFLHKRTASLPNRKPQTTTSKVSALAPRGLPCCSLLWMTAVKIRATKYLLPGAA